MSGGHAHSRCACCCGSESRVGGGRWKSRGTTAAVVTASSRTAPNAQSPLLKIITTKRKTGRIASAHTEVECQARFLQSRAGCVSAVTIWTGTAVRNTETGGGEGSQRTGGQWEETVRRCRERC